MQVFIVWVLYMNNYLEYKYGMVGNHYWEKCEVAVVWEPKQLRSWFQNMQWRLVVKCEVSTRYIQKQYSLVTFWKWSLLWMFQMSGGLRWKRETVFISCILETSVVFTEISTNTWWEKRELCEKCWEIKGQGSMYHIFIFYTDFSFVFIISQY
jgi:hypothetical protein